MLILPSKWKCRGITFPWKSAHSFRSHVLHLFEKFATRILFFSPWYLLVALTISLIYGEIILPRISRAKWPNAVKDVLADDPRVTRILFIGSVGLIDKYYSGMVGAVARWDTDRFLTHSFDAAVSLIKPHIVVSAGDIFAFDSVLDDEEIDKVLIRFDTIFQTRHLRKSGVEFSVLLGAFDKVRLQGACIAGKCPKEFTTFFEPQLVHSSVCRWYGNETSLLLHYFGDSYLQDENCKLPFDTSENSQFKLRFVAGLFPVVTYMPKSMFFDGGSYLDAAGIMLVRDFRPHFVVASRGTFPGIYFCSNCMTLGAGGMPLVPDGHWMNTPKDSDPLTFRLPSSTDGGGRGGSQPHITIPPAGYHLPSLEGSGYAVALVDRSTQTLTYLVLWNYNRLAIMTLYKLLLIITLIRLLAHALAILILRFNIITKWWKSTNSKKRQIWI